MTLFLFLLLCGALFALVCNYKKISRLLLVITLILFYMIGSGVMPAWLLTSLQSDDWNRAEPRWGKNNAIVVLGSGAVKPPATSVAIPSLGAFSRILTGATLYHACQKEHRHCTLIVSGGDALKVGESEAVIYQRELIALGIDKKHILIEPNSMNTYKNAEYTSKILNQHHFDQVILVTSAFHLKRAALYFSQFKIHAEPIPADYLAAKVSFSVKGLNFALTEIALHEWGGIVRLYFYDLFGWNVSSSSPGAL